MTSLQGTLDELEQEKNRNADLKELLRDAIFIISRELKTFPSYTSSDLKDWAKDSGFIIKEKTKARSLNPL